MQWRPTTASCWEWVKDKGVAQQWFSPVHWSSEVSVLLWSIVGIVAVVLLLALAIWPARVALPGSPRCWL